VASKDRDALGLQPPAPDAATGSSTTGSIDEQTVWDTLKTCYDPEIPVNIVDLGLVYQCGATPLPDGGNKVEVRFTLTAPGCGMGDVLREDIRGKLLTLPDVKEADVQVLFDPPWNMSMMSEAAKLQLGLM
jgi:probable FeS assembly SUF system protein SufT